MIPVTRTKETFADETMEANAKLWDAYMRRLGAIRDTASIEELSAILEALVQIRRRDADIVTQATRPRHIEKRTLHEAPFSDATARVEAHTLEYKMEHGTATDRDKERYQVLLTALRGVRKQELNEENKVVVPPVKANNTLRPVPSGNVPSTLRKPVLKEASKPAATAKTTLRLPVLKKASKPFPSGKAPSTLRLPGLKKASSKPVPSGNASTKRTAATATTTLRPPALKKASTKRTAATAARVRNEASFSVATALAEASALERKMGDGTATDEDRERFRVLLAALQGARKQEFNEENKVAATTVKANNTLRPVPSSNVPSILRLPGLKNASKPAATATTTLRLPGLKNASKPAATATTTLRLVPSGNASTKRTSATATTTLRLPVLKKAPKPVPSGNVSSILRLPGLKKASKPFPSGNASTKRTAATASGMPTVKRVTVAFVWLGGQFVWSGFDIFRRAVKDALRDDAVTFVDKTMDDKEDFGDVDAVIMIYQDVGSRFELEENQHVPECLRRLRDRVVNKKAVILMWLKQRMGGGVPPDDTPLGQTVNTTHVLKTIPHLLAEKMFIELRLDGRPKGLYKSDNQDACMKRIVTAIRALAPPPAAIPLPRVTRAGASLPGTQTTGVSKAAVTQTSGVSPVKRVTVAYISHKVVDNYFNFVGAVQQALSDPTVTFITTTMQNAIANPAVIEAADVVIVMFYNVGGRIGTDGDIPSYMRPLSGIGDTASPFLSVCLLVSFRVCPQ
jgi:hypothetical protein